MVETKKEPVIGGRFSQVSEKQALLEILAVATALRFLWADYKKLVVNNLIFSIIRVFHGAIH